MKYPTQNNVKKLGITIRILAGFTFFCGLVATLGLGFAIVTEPFHPVALFGVFVIVVMLHVSGSIAINRFAPKYLLFAHGPK